MNNCLEIAQLNNGEPVESFRQEWRLNTIEARRHEYRAHHYMRQRQILEAKEVHALAENLRLMLFLNPEAVARVLPSQTLFKDCQNI